MKHCVGALEEIRKTRAKCDAQLSIGAWISWTTRRAKLQEIISLGTTGVWTSSLEISDTGAGLNLMKKDLLQVSCLRRNWQRRYRLPSSRIKHANGNQWTHKPQSSEVAAVQKICFLVVPSLAANVILCTSFIGKHVEKISSNADIITTMNSRPGTLVVAMNWDYVLTIESLDSLGKLERFVAKPPWQATTAAALAQMRETLCKSIRHREYLASGYSQASHLRNDKLWPRKV